MKRISFYSLHRPDGLPLQAVMHDGYTDGKFNYYRNAAGVWFAISPETGLSLTSGRTRRYVVEYANSDHVKLYLPRWQESPAWERWCSDFRQHIEARKRYNLTHGSEVLIS